jgi:hypothetical protein
MTIFIYVGAPKCATGTLQAHAFHGHPEISFHGWPPGHLTPAIQTALYCETQYFKREVIERARSVVRKAYGDGPKPVVLSREHLTYYTFDAGLTADRLSQIFAGMKLILCIREQVSQLESAYLWTLRNLRVPVTALPYDSFETYIERNWNSFNLEENESRDIVRSAFFTADYAAIVKHYERCIGRENVGVFVFEELVRNPDAFCQKLFGFIGVSPIHRINGERVNERLTRRQYWYWWLLRMFMPLPISGAMHRWTPSRVDNWLGRGPRMEVDLSVEWRERLALTFASGNRYLAETFNLPLGDYGYALA